MRAPSQRVLRLRQKSQALSDFLANGAGGGVIDLLSSGLYSSSLTSFTAAMKRERNGRKEKRGEGRRSSDIERAGPAAE